MLASHSSITEEVDTSKHWQRLNVEALKFWNRHPSALQVPRVNGPTTFTGSELLTTRLSTTIHRQLASPLFLLSQSTRSIDLARLWSSLRSIAEFFSAFQLQS